MAVDVSRNHFQAVSKNLQELGCTANILKQATVNVVATFCCGCRLNVELNAELFRPLFKVELLPAVQFWLQRNKAMTDIFCTGKCTILGAKPENNKVLKEQCEFRHRKNCQRANLFLECVKTVPKRHHKTFAKSCPTPSPHPTPLIMHIRYFLC